MHTNQIENRDEKSVVLQKRLIFKVDLKLVLYSIKDKQY